MREDCLNWVPQGDTLCSFCGDPAPKGALSKAWEITQFATVPLSGLEAAVKKCPLYLDDAPAESGEIVNEEACE